MFHRDKTTQLFATNGFICFFVVIWPFYSCRSIIKHLKQIKSSILWTEIWYDYMIYFHFSKQVRAMLLLAQLTSEACSLTAHEFNVLKIKNLRVWFFWKNILVLCERQTRCDSERRPCWCPMPWFDTEEVILRQVGSLSGGCVREWRGRWPLQHHYTSDTDRFPLVAAAFLSCQASFSSFVDVDRDPKHTDNG